MRLRLTAGIGMRISAMLTLVALALMVWSLLQPTPLPVMVAMSVGQALGTIAFGIFGWVVFKDLTRARAERKSLDRISLVNIQLPPKLRDRQAKAAAEAKAAEPAKTADEAKVDEPAKPADKPEDAS